VKLKCVLKKWYLIKKTVSEVKLICQKQISVVNLVIFYRYSSLLITSILYYFSSPHEVVLQRLIIISGMLLACGVLTYLYIDNRSNRNYILILTLVETFGNGFFIIVSGGFASPYIWYSISTLFITTVELPIRYAMLQASIYFFSAGISTASTISSEMSGDIIRLYLNIAISYILVVLGLLQLIEYAVKNEEKTIRLSLINEELKEANSKVEKTLKYCIEIYETVNIFNLDGSKNVLNELLDHLGCLTGIQQSMFLRLAPENRHNIDIYVSHGLTEFEEQQVLSQAKKLLAIDTENITYNYCDYDNKKLSLNLVEHGNTPYGAFITITDDTCFLETLAIKHMEDLVQEKANTLEQYNVLPIFMEIAGIVLKKLELDDIGEKLLISEEQNRIANEIHDIALQKLFAISCNLYILSTRSHDQTEEELRNELLVIKRSVDNTMKELREAIYGFSWEKEGEDTFKNKLMKYTDEIHRLQGIEATTEIIGDTQKIVANQKNGLYRVICEAMNNAVRHGKAKHVRVRVIIGDSRTTVRITDDGEGFDYEEYLKKNDKGIGLDNIYRIVKLLNGNIEVKSKIPGGTEIYLSIPGKAAA
jgi:signal transduction histidine kinase